MGKKSLKNIISIGVMIFGLAGVRAQVHANPYSYPAVRYLSPYSESLGGVSLPVSDELGNSLFNNPAALAKNTFFKAEYLNLNVDLNSGVMGSLTSVTSFPSLGGFSSTLNSNPNKIYSGGFGNLSAVSWGGFAFGLLLQERVRAYSDGSNVHYETQSQIIPSAGYGFSLARGVVRVGYALQLVSQASGITQSISDSSAAYLKGLSEGKGLSHQASVNFVFPFTYTPTVSILARNIGGLKFSSGGLLHRASSPSGAPSDQEMSVDAAFNFMVRLSGPIKSDWFLQYRDLTSSTSLTALEKLSFGVDLSVSQAVAFRVGINDLKFNAGLGYRSDSSEINLAYYNDPSPFSNISAWDTRYALQYKVFFQDKNQRDRDAELRAK